MFLLSRLKAPPVAPLHSRTSSAAAPLQRRRLTVASALWILSLGTLSAIAYRTGCAQSSRSSLLRPKFSNQPSTQAFQSAGMAASNTVSTIVVYVTVPNRDAGVKLANSIVKEKLAACVNIVPGLSWHSRNLLKVSATDPSPKNCDCYCIQSVYWWDGKMQTDSEELLIIKTRESLLSSLTEHVKANHEYEVPEVIALPINGGNEKYLEWIKNSTRDT